MLTDWNNRCNRKMVLMWLISWIRKELLLSIWQEAQSGQQSTRQRKFVKMVYANTPRVVEALKGDRCLIDGLCSGKSRACQKSTRTFRCRKASRSASISFIPPFMGQMRRQLLPYLEIMPRREAYIKELRDSPIPFERQFYLDFLIDIEAENGRDSWSSRKWKVSAVARKGHI